MNYISFQSYEQALVFTVLSTDFHEINGLRQYANYVDTVNNTVLLYFSSESDKKYFVLHHMDEFFSRPQTITRSNHHVIYKEQHSYYVIQTVFGKNPLFEVLKKLFSQYSFDVQDYLDGADVDDIESFDKPWEIKGSIISDDNTVEIYFETFQTAIGQWPYLKINSFLELDLE